MSSLRSIFLFFICLTFESSMSDLGETSDVDVLNTSLSNLSLEGSEGVFYSSLKNFERVSSLAHWRTKASPSTKASSLNALFLCIVL